MPLFMNNKNNNINRIINRYQGDKELYKALKRFSASKPLSEEEEQEIMKSIKKTITNYYLQIYPYSNHMVNGPHGDMLSTLNNYCDLTVRVGEHNGKWKVYPIKDTDENKKLAYSIMMKKMVDYQIDNNLPMDIVFDRFTRIVRDELRDFEQRIIEGEMEPYYGSPSFIVDRSKFIIECAREIPGVDINFDDINYFLTSFENKYLGRENSREKSAVFDVYTPGLIEEYEKLESCYKELLELEDRLAPIVFQYWREYLSNPKEHDDSDYRYVMHCFSNGMVPPNEMKKACCSLHTSDLNNFMYGTSGLIYGLDADSVDSMCTEDAGSWVTDKSKFVKDLCTVWEQLTDPNHPCPFYEEPMVSRLIMPETFERECRRKQAIKDGDTIWLYSEIFLNSKARPQAVFYTEDCPNIEEVREYAEKYGLPLVSLPVKKEVNNKRIH